MTAVEIRHATDADAGTVARLLEQLGYAVDPADVPSRLARMADRHRGAVLLAVAGNDVIGLATMHVMTVLNRARDVAWLTALVVDRDARGGGVGRLLVRAVEDLARRSGCERVSVTTHEDRLGAREFYPRVGYEPTGRRFGKVLG